MEGEPVDINHIARSIMECELNVNPIYFLRALESLGHSKKGMKEFPFVKTRNFSRHM